MVLSNWHYYIVRLLDTLSTVFSAQSSKKTEAFWLAAVLVFCGHTPRLKYLPDLFIPADFLLLSQPMMVGRLCANVVYLMIVGLLAYSTIFWQY